MLCEKYQVHTIVGVVHELEQIGDVTVPVTYVLVESPDEEIKRINIEEINKVILKP